MAVNTHISNNLPYEKLLPRFLVILGAIVYLALLNWIYITNISPTYDYFSYTYTPPPLQYSILSWTLAIIPSFWMPLRLKRPSQVVYWLLYVMAYVPSCLIPFFTVRLDPFQVLLLVVVIFLSFAVLGSIYRLPLLPVPRIRIPPLVFWTALFAISAGFYAYIIRLYGFHINFVAFLDVYDLRSQYRESFSESSLVDYFVNWLANAINPFLIAQGFMRRNLLLLAIGGVGQFILYSTTGYKSVFFSLLYIALLYVLLRITTNRFGTLLLWSFAGLVLLTAIASNLMHSALVAFLLVGRPIITPGLLTGHYFEFFSLNPQVLLSHSILKSFFAYPYPVNPPFLIGIEYFNDPNTQANANIWADAYSNFGYAGVFIFPCILAGILWLVDSIARNRDLRFAVLMLAMPGFTLSNVPLFTTIMTSGLAFAILLLYTYPVIKKGLAVPPPQVRPVTVTEHL